MFRRIKTTTSCRFQIFYFIPIIIVLFCNVIDSGIIPSADKLDGIDYQITGKSQLKIISILHSWRALNHLTLSNCQITNFTELTTVSGVKTINKLTIDSSSIQPVKLKIDSKYAGTWMESLKEFTVINSSINMFDINITLQLKYLNLSNNKMSSFVHLYDNTKNLTHLNLSYNPLTRFVYRSSYNQTDGINIDLSHMKGVLRNVEISVNTNFLDLQHNQISDLDVLNLTSPVARINLSNNLLTKLPNLTHPSYGKFIGFVNVASNQFICNMQLTLQMLILEHHHKIKPGSVDCSFSNQQDKIDKPRYPVSEYGMFLDSQSKVNDYFDVKKLNQSLEILNLINFTISYDGSNVDIHWNVDNSNYSQAFIEFKLLNKDLRVLNTSTVNIDDNHTRIPTNEPYIIICAITYINDTDIHPVENSNSILGKCFSRVSPIEITTTTTKSPYCIVPYSNKYVYCMLGVLVLYIALTIYPIYVCMCQCIWKRQSHTRKYSNSVPHPPHQAATRKGISNQTSVGNMAKYEPEEYDSTLYGDIGMTSVGGPDTYIYTNPSEVDGFSKDSIAKAKSGTENATYVGMDDESNLYDSTVVTQDGQYEDMNVINETKI